MTHSKWIKRTLLLAITVIIIYTNRSQILPIIEPTTQKIQTLFQKKEPLQLPLQNGHLPTGETIKGQWKEKDRPFVLTNRNNTPIYAKPNQNTPPLQNLKRSERVTVLYLENSQEDLSNPWAFIASYTESKPLGWTLKEHLAFKYQFKKMKHWSESDFAFSKGNYRAKFQTFSNASFINHWQSNGEGLQLSNTEKGHFYEFNNLIYAHTKNYSPYVHIFDLTDSGLEHEQRFKEFRLVFPSD